MGRTGKKYGSNCTRRGCERLTRDHKGGAQNASIDSEQLHSGQRLARKRKKEPLHMRTDIQIDIFVESASEPSDSFRLRKGQTSKQSSWGILRSLEFQTRTLSLEEGSSVDLTQ